ncbi:helix-turn-helix domain-containing protein [Amycolatopsis sp. H20-H5]|uniref:helix-turn-helix domain-containing protein n=1 Tax=Amycolatopsis sp. H20-H5 TaxID=3046309 RepID=UPI002DBAA94A|nr:helix-turn-helix domain-containing protein [Amycolatopsis sp. H20-H5]MEC3975535.1 helix-turn-helix domain-containing protein [Amycolatopsis sp. H20-H5]
MLPLYSDVLSAEFELDVLTARKVGAAWAESGRTLARMLEATSSLTADLVDRALNHCDLQVPERYCAAVQKFSRVGSQVLIELTQGFRQACVAPRADEELTQRRRAQLLLAGEAGFPAGIGYAVVALSTGGQDPTRVDAAFQAEGGEHTLSFLAEEGGHVLLHATDEADAIGRGRRALAALEPISRAALVWSGERGVAESRAVADDVLAETQALGREPGLHLLDDVLLEFAVARDPLIANVLLKVIDPLLSQPLLWETLQAIIEENGNRGRVADRLVLHRSTVDYRLQRIAQQTGHSPCTIRGLRVLATASALHRLAEVRSRCTGVVS